MVAPSNPPRILVVDDEADIAESFVDLLHVTYPDAQITHALSAREALQLLRGGPVDLLVTDFMMPGMNGVQLLGEAEKLSPGTPNILITAYGEDIIRKAGFPQPQRILQKPIDIDAFQGAVDAALASA